MSTKGMTYKKRTRALDKGAASPARFDERVLVKAVQIDDGTVYIGFATNEEFYYYVYDWLLQHYEDAGQAEARYRETFDLDWSDWRNRVVALNEMDALNEIRRSNKRKMLPLFAEEAL